MSAGRPEPLVHHELCFGCGRANLFGLLAQLERDEEGVVTGRCFLKQDHKGAMPGIAHEGLLAAALAEAMSFACGARMHAISIALTLEGSASVGSHLELRAEVHETSGGRIHASATGTAEGAAIATARGIYEAT